jgi:hypothetical protein
MNMGIFGATALGPVIGGAIAGAGAWRLLLWIVAGLGAGTVAFSLLTFEDQEPMDRSAPWDPLGISLAGIGSGALFFGVSYASAQPFVSLAVLGPLALGAAALLGTILWEFFSRRPLMPLRSLAHTYPVVGVITAMVAGASSVALIELTQTALQAKGASPLEAGLLFVPEFGGAVIAAIAFGALFRTRYTPVLAMSGLLLLAAGGALVVNTATGSDAVVIAGSALIGLGTGFSVAPALFISGFSLPSNALPRVFALIELLRGVAAFLAGPLLLLLAQSLGGASGLQTATWIAFALPLAGATLVLGLFLLGHGRLQDPDIEPWVEGEKAAIDSHPVLAAARGVPRPEAREPEPAGRP